MAPEHKGNKLPKKQSNHNTKATRYPTEETEKDTKYGEADAVNITSNQGREENRERERERERERATYKGDQGVRSTHATHIQKRTHKTHTRNGIQQNEREREGERERERESER